MDTPMPVVQITMPRLTLPLGHSLGRWRGKIGIVAAVPGVGTKVLDLMPQRLQVLFDCQL